MSLFLSSFRRSFMNLSPSAKIFLLVFFVFISATVGSFLAVLIAMPFYNYGFSSLITLLQSPSEDNIGIIKFLQVFQSIIMFIIPALLCAWLFSDNTFRYIGAHKKITGVNFLLISVSVIAAIPFLNLITKWNAGMDLPAWLNGLEERMIQMEKSAEKLTELFLMDNAPQDLYINILMIAILPALGEEFLFRGILQRLLAEWTNRIHIAIIASAFIFSFIHFQFYGFIPRFLLGLYFGYLFAWTGSIWTPVLAHFINNATAVIYYHFSESGVGDSGLDTIGAQDQGDYIVYISVFFSALLIGAIYLNEKKGNLFR